MTNKNEKIFVSEISMSTMFIRIILFCCLLLSTDCTKQPPHRDHKCLTGYMTEIQSWVDGEGGLTAPDGFESAIDLSTNPNPVPLLQQTMSLMRSGRDVYVKYLSMALCRLTMVPTVFLFSDTKGRILAETLEYITFYGNEFSDMRTPGEFYEVSINATGSRERDFNTPFQRSLSVTWYSGFMEAVFPNLKELDLRACRIQILSDNIFKGMPKLEALYIGENEVMYIDADAFAGLKNLVHLDFSQNEAYDEKGHQQILTTETMYVFKSLKNLSSLDLSFTKLALRHVSLLKFLGPKMTKLSLCETGLTNLNENIFSKTSLKILDLSGNSGVLSQNRTLGGLENTLQILYARNIGLRTMDIFEKFVQLEILNLSMNEIATVNPRVTETLKSLQILDLDLNRITSWFTPTFALLPSLKLLSLRDNNINLISEEIIADIANVQYLAMSGNFIVCNCHTREFFDLALQNEKKQNHEVLSGMSFHLKLNPEPLKVLYHRGFLDFNEQIKHRSEVSNNCTEEVCYDLNEELQAKFLILDYHPGSYMCLLVAESTPTEFSQVEGCNRRIRDMDYDTVIQDNILKLFILLIIPVVLIILVFAYIFRRNFRYCYITLRNSAMLSLVHKNEFIDESSIFHYDVFVSYSNEDRGWVLDHLLPHLESDCCISACLHERDFQVGHSILENIVSCMDRSRSIMLIISKRFLLSQWCQFEMHLAQHRLLETRREDLTLVFLEEIPRRLRPNTLHYLMLTKTYIVWPKEVTERALFWKRLKKTLVTMKQRQSTIEGVSLA